ADMLFFTTIAMINSSLILTIQASLPVFNLMSSFLLSNWLIFIYLQIISGDTSLPLNAFLKFFKLSRPGERLNHYYFGYFYPEAITGAG
ncbi:hypothetical protein, partial [uncultured Anaerovibrio sp.]|uniref:hypothetical protein n=1 Tax=uncultured Anaerovibrio sp. TaxID=361586 RepID=UPI00260D1766